MIFRKKKHTGDNVVILGGRGHAREIVDLIEDINQYPDGTKNILGLIVPTKEAATLKNSVAGYNILGKDEWLEVTLRDQNHQIYKKNREQYVDEVIIGIGDPKIREKLTKRFEQYIVDFSTLIHPSVTYDPKKIHIGQGVIIAKNVSLTTDITLYNHVQLNTACTVCHDVHIGNHTIVSPGAIICGNVTIGTRCFIGAGAVIKDGIKIAEDTTIGAGAVVTKNILKPGTYVGVPARLIG